MGLSLTCSTLFRQAKRGVGCEALSSFIIVLETTARENWYSISVSGNTDHLCKEATRMTFKCFSNIIKYLLHPVTEDGMRSAKWTCQRSQNYNIFSKRMDKQPRLRITKRNGKHLRWRWPEEGRELETERARCRREKKKKSRERQRDEEREREATRYKRDRETERERLTTERERDRKKESETERLKDERNKIARCMRPATEKRNASTQSWQLWLLSLNAQWKSKPNLMKNIIRRHMFLQSLSNYYNRIRELAIQIFVSTSTQCPNPARTPKHHFQQVCLAYVRNWLIQSTRPRLWFVHLQSWPCVG